MANKQSKCYFFPKGLYLLCFFAIGSLAQVNAASETCSLALNTNEFDDLCSCNCCETSGSFFISGSFLYWNGKRNNLDFGFLQEVNVIGIDPPKTVDAANNKVGPNYSWDPGVMASIGYTTCNCDCVCNWRIFLTGTYFHTTAKGKNTTPTPQTGDQPIVSFVPTWNPAFVGNHSERSKAKWELYYGTIDLLTGPEFSPCDGFTMALNFGLRAAWINQSYAINYFNSEFLIFNGAEFLTVIQPHASSKYSTHLRTIGFKGGVDFEKCLCSYLSIIGSFSGSLSYGRTSLKQKLLGATPNAGGILENSITINSSDKIERIVANLENELGISTCLADMFHLSASYYFNIWFDQSDFGNSLFTNSPQSEPQPTLLFPTESISYGNLMIQGLIVRVRIDF